jgi:AcrR family transcriptional regulator
MKTAGPQGRVSAARPQGKAKGGQDAMRALDADVRKVRALVEDGDLVAIRRERLVEVATHLFRTKGFHETATREIAAGANVSVGAIYQYIRHKDDLLLLILQSVVDVYQERLYPFAHAEGTATERLTSAVDVYYKILDENHEKTQVLYHEFSGLKGSDHREHMNEVERAVTDVIQRIVEQGVACGEFKPVDSLFIAHMVVSLGHSWALRRWRFRGVMTINEYIDQTQLVLAQVLES